MQLNTCLPLGSMVAPHTQEGRFVAGNKSRWSFRFRQITKMSPGIRSDLTLRATAMSGYEVAAIIISGRRSWRSAEASRRIVR